MADAQIKTTIDALLELVRAKGRTDINTIASQIGASPAIIENWVKILEKGGLVKVTYELGKMYVAPAVAASESTKTLEAKVNVEEEILGTEFESKILEVSKLSEVITNLRASLITANKAYAERFPELERRLNEINKIYEQMNQENAAALQMKNSLERTYDEVSKRVSDLTDKIKAIESKSAGSLSDAVQEEQGLLEKANLQSKGMQGLKAQVDKWAQDTMKNFESEVAKMKAEIAKQGSDVRQQLKQQEEQFAATNATVTERLKEAKGVITEVQGFNRQSGRQKAALDRSVKEFSDRYAKSYDTMSRGLTILNDRSKQLQSGIESVKEGFGDVSKVYDMMHELRSGIESSEKSVRELREELEGLKQELSKLKSKSVGTQEKADSIRQIQQKSQDVDTKMSEFKKGFRGLLEKMKVDESPAASASKDNKARKPGSGRS